MRLHKITLLAAALSLAGLSLTSAQTSLSSHYDFTTLDAPDPQAVATYPLGINSSRAIAGYYQTPDMVAHGFLYKNGKFTPIVHPKALAKPNGGTIAGGINDRGDIVGVYSDKNGFLHGFLLTKPEECGDDDPRESCGPVFRDINVPGAAQLPEVPFEFGFGLGTGAVGINNHSQIVGLFATTGKYSLGFELTEDGFKHIDDPNSAHVPSGGSKMFSINNHGVMAGDYALVEQTPQGPALITHGFLYDGEKFTEMFIPGSDLGGFGLGTQVNGINDSKMVVGTFTDPTPRLRGLVWAGGTFYTLDYPNTPFNEAHSINKQGDITGAYSADQFGNGIIHGFLATPKSH